MPDQRPHLPAGLPAEPRRRRGRRARSSTAAPSRPRRRSASRSPCWPTCSPTATTAPPPRCATASAARRWREIPMEPLGNDRFRATFVPDQLGRWQYQVVGWLDHLGTWRHGMELKLAAGVDVAVDLQIGIGPARRGPERPKLATADAAALAGLRRRLAAGDTRLLGRLPSEDEPPPRRRPHPRPRRRRARAGGRHDGLDLDALFWRAGDPRAGRRAGPPGRRRGRSRSGPGSAPGTSSSRARRWPRPTGHGTLLDALERLDYVAAMGFDVLYLPPVHPIGTTQRKGRNNTTTPRSDRHRQPVGDRRARGRAHRRAPRAGHRRRRHQDRRGLPRAGHRAGPRPRVPVHAGPPVGHRAPDVVRPPARRHHPVRREPAQEVPGHLPARLRERRLAGPVDRRWPTSSGSGSTPASRSSASTTRTPRRSRSGSG